MSSSIRTLLLTGGALALIGYATGCLSPKPRHLPTVAQVDLGKYVGHWYEIFRLPNTFQAEGAKAEAQYTINDDESVKVVNSQTRTDGTKSSIEGRAVPVAGSGNSRLKVRFEGFASLAYVPKEGNYWIIDVEPDYSLALVGTPDRKFLWLLARDKNVPEAKVKEYVKKAKSLGFNTEKLFYANW